MTTPTIDELLQRIAKINHGDASDTIQETVNRIEDRLVGALNGGHLLALPNLGTAAVPFHGLALDGSTRIPFPASREERSRTVPVLTDRGRVLGVYSTRNPVAAASSVAWFSFVTTNMRIDAAELMRLVDALPRVLQNHLHQLDVKRTIRWRAATKASSWLEDKPAGRVTGSRVKVVDD